MKKTLLFCLVISLMLALCTAVSAAGAAVELQVSAPDAGGIVTATLVVKDAQFNALQGMISFNPAVLQPVDSSGAATTDFAAMRSFPTASVQQEGSEIGCAIDAQGRISFAFYRAPGQSGSFSADANGLSVYKFTFKKIGTGLLGIGLAYPESGSGFNQGLLLVDGNAGSIAATFTVIAPAAISADGKDSKVSETPVATQPGDAPVSNALVIATRANGTVALKIDNPVAVVGGARRNVDADNNKVAPYIKASRTMVPVRFISESLGATVSYVSAEKKVVVVLGDRTINMFVGRADWTINGVAQKELDAPAEISFDRTFVPFRAIGEALDKAVEWVNADRTVIISPQDNPFAMANAVDELFYNHAKAIMAA